MKKTMIKKELDNNPLGIEYVEPTEGEKFADKRIVALLLSYGIQHIDNPFKSIYVKDVAKDLKIGKNKAYELFKDENFPSINIGKTWQIAYIAYLKWKCDNNKKL